MGVTLHPEVGGNTAPTPGAILPLGVGVISSHIGGAQVSSRIDINTIDSFIDLIIRNSDSL